MTSGGASSAPRMRTAAVETASTASARSHPSRRVLNAPTNEAWIDPWVTFLKGMPNVQILNNRLVTEIHFDSGAKDATIECRRLSC